MQPLAIHRPPTLIRVVVICVIGVLLGGVSIWLPPVFVLMGIGGLFYLGMAGDCIAVDSVFGIDHI